MVNWWWVGGGVTSQVGGGVTSQVGNQSRVIIRIGFSGSKEIMLPMARFMGSIEGIIDNESRDYQWPSLNR